MAMLLACWAVCGTLAVVVARRPVWGVIAVLVLWSVLPSTAASVVVGADVGPLSTHPATWLTLALAAVQMVVAPAAMARGIARRPLIWLALGLFFSIAFVTTVSAGGAGVKTAADQVVGPVALFAVLSGPVAAGPAHEVRRRVRLLSHAVVVVAACQSALALVQTWTGSIQVYGRFFERLYWFDPETQSRWMGTTDSPLVLSLLVAAAAPLVVRYSSLPLRVALLGLFGAASASTQSRVGLAVVVLVTAFVLVRARVGVLQRVLTAAVVLGLGWYVAGLTIVDGVSRRVQNDTGSTDARADALTFFFSHVHQYLFVGDGAGASYDVARASGLITSLENPVMMYAIDYGALVAAAYFLAQAAVLVQALPRSRTPGLAVAAAVAVLVQLSFSSVGASNLVGTFVWLLLGACAVDASARCDGSQASGAPARRNASTSLAS